MTDANHSSHPEKKINFRLNTKLFAIFAVCLASSIFAYFHYFYDKAYLQIQMSSSVDSEFQIYWASSGQPYAEERSRKFNVSKRKYTYVLYFEDLDRVDQVRIDPIRKKGNVIIHSITIRQEEYEPIYLTDVKRLLALQPSDSVVEAGIVEDGLRVVSSGEDPQLNFEFSKRKITSDREIELIRLLVAVILSFLVAQRFSRGGFGVLQVRDTAFYVVLSLIAIMAIMSRFGLHPDEGVHFQAASYYETHWLPPRICDPETLYTYSRYGVSRLDTKEVAYVVAGKVCRFISHQLADPHIRYRLFNILLFIGVIVLWHKKKEYRLFFLPFVISPQIWYVYSYFSSDAFALSLGVLITLQIIDKDSFFISTLNQDPWDRYFFFKCMLCGVMIGAYWFVKINYQILFAFWAGYALLELFEKRHTLRPRWKNIGCLALSVVLFVVFVNTVHLYVNGLDRTKKIADCMEKTADFPFKPSTPFPQQWPTLNIKAKGLPLSFVLDYSHWGSRMFATSFGVYGHTSIIALPMYYRIVQFFFVALLVYAGLKNLFLSEIKEKLLLLGALACSVAIMVAALLHSWIVDIQAQGRYLFSIVPMMGVVFYRTKTLKNDALFHFLIYCLFVAGLYSFVFVGLVNMVIGNNLPF